MKAICRRAHDLCDDEQTLSWGGKLMHPISFLDLAKDQVTNVEGALLDIVVMVVMKLLIMEGLPHYCLHSTFFEAVEVDSMCLFCFSFVVMLYVRHIEDDVCREDGLRTVDLEEG
jgi:hypothetical protein